MAKQSFRMGLSKNKKFVIKYQDKKVVDWANGIKTQILSQLPKGYKLMTDPVMIKRLIYIFPILKSLSKVKKAMAINLQMYKMSKPDVDNLQKNLFDAFNQIVWRDDSQVCHINNLIKMHGARPGVIIEVEEIDQFSLELSNKNILTVQGRFK